MSEQQFESSAHPRMTPAVQWLIAVNVAIYFLQLTLFRSDYVFSLLGLSAERFPEGWWTLGTYMFVHAGLWHIALNMLALWMFGPRVEHVWNSRSFLYFYLWCGLGGAITQLLLERNAVLVGASAAVSGVMLAYALRWPDDEVYLFGVIPMKTRWLVVWMVVINLAMGVSSNRSSSGIGWFAHLGGLAFAWVYLRVSAFGGFDSVRRWVSPVPDEPEDAFRAIHRMRARNRDRAAEREAQANAPVDEVVAKSKAIVARPASRALVPRAQDANAHPTAERLDMVLDKISRQGIQSLTTDELRLLEEMSKRLRGKADT